MSEELERYQARHPVPAIDDEQSSYLATIERLSSKPDIDVEKIKQIMEMQEHILDRNAKQAFNAAMVQAQKKMPIIPKDLKNTLTNSMYSAYETILKHAKPVYTAEGFSVQMYEGDTEKPDHIRVCADVGHEDGHTKTFWTDLPLDNVGIKGNVNKTGIHAKKSSLSYGKGILMCMVFNIPTGHDVDDDGNAAGEPAKEFITPEQAKEITALIKEKNIDVVKWLARLKIETVDTLPATWYEPAMRDLKKAAVRREPGSEG